MLFSFLADRVLPFAKQKLSLVRVSFSDKRCKIVYIDTDKVKEECYCIQF